jgi:hypothetical protein
MENASSGRWWLWFGAGFLLVFVGMLLLVTRLAMHPSGEYLVQYPLWMYYGVMLPRFLETTRTLGPGSEAHWAALETGLFHLLLSTAGGLVAVAVCRISDRGR